MEVTGLDKLQEYVKTTRIIKEGLASIAQNIIVKAQNEAPKIKKTVHQRFLPEQRRIAREQFDKAVDAFYADYSPQKYRRRSYGTHTGTLYSGWKYELEQELNQYGSLQYDSAADLLDPKNAMTVTRSGSNAGGFFFNQMFVGGWHGGAMTISGEAAEDWWEHPAPGRAAYWRKKGVTPNGVLHRWGAWYEEPAPNFADTHNGKSPYTYYADLLDKAEDERMMPIFNAIRDDVCDEYLADFTRKEIIRGVNSILEKFQ